MIIVVSTHSYKLYVVIYLLSLSSIIRMVLLHQILDVILCLAVMMLLKMLAWSSMKRILSQLTRFFGEYQVFSFEYVTIINYLILGLFSAS